MNEDSSDDETAGPSTQSGPSGVARYDISKYYYVSSSLSFRPSPPKQESKFEAADLD